MTTNLENNTISRVTSLDFQDSNLKVNRNVNGSVSALVKHKEGYREKPEETINKAGLNGQLVQSKDTAPHTQVSVEFAAKQLFQILLMDIQYRNSKLNKLEPAPVPFAGI